MNIFKQIHTRLLPEDRNLSYIPYLSLAYLTIFFVNIYFNPVSGYDLVAVIGTIIVFLICYFRAYWCQGRQLVFCIISILILGMAMSAINFGASVFFVYGAVFCAYFKTQKMSMYALIMVIISIGLFSALTHQSGYFWIPATLFSFIIGLMLIHQEEVDRKNKAIKLSQQQIQALAQTAERERISRDLHDILGHSLSVITLKSELASKMIDKEMPLEKIRNEIKQVEQLSRETLAQVRGAVTGYNQATIDTELLQAGVATDAANITLNTTISSMPLSPTIESQLALILREAITNIIRHADTQQAWVSLSNNDSTIELSISDQGNMENYQANTGLNNMRERINKLGGSMIIESKPTCLRFNVPITSSSLRNA
jgi:two-component system sensor histidine kinase DesK